MAQKVQVTLVDDIDGGPADETVTFAIDGISYEIDLTESHATALREALAAFVGAGRRVAGRSTAGSAARAPRARAGRSVGSGVDTGAIRAWARDQGIAVNDRGRLSASLVEKYQAAHGG
jgi:hypothetical protein